MEILKTFRHEQKYVISYDEMLRLRAKFNDILTIDRDYNGYMIRSLYFDSIDDEDYYDKLNGEMNRKKIRLRIYDPNGELVKLELKAKYDYHQLKESLIINKEDLAKRIYIILMEGYYKPKVIIEYNRIAYMGKTTTRITFDYEIKTSNNIESFFEKDINYIETIDKKDIVLEVKFDRLLEPYISTILDKYISRSQSVSKYMMGRNN